jgi:hypothetical protein
MKSRVDVLEQNLKQIAIEATPDPGPSPATPSDVGLSP